jgi:Flp pilus assembly pilin Flp
VSSQVEQEIKMSEIMTKILSYVRNERGAEMVEWIVVVAVLAVVALAVFGPNGVLQNALSGGVNKIANSLNSLPQAS